MTPALDTDRELIPKGKSALLPFSEDEVMQNGLRVTRAEFSRLMGVSKQAVTEWVRSGKILLGVDGRLDPRQAFAQLLKNGDASRMRAKIIAPLVQEVARTQQKIAPLQAALAKAREDADFYGTCVDEFLDIQKAFLARLRASWRDLHTMDESEVWHRLNEWLEMAAQVGKDPGLSLTDATLKPPLPRACDNERGGGHDTHDEEEK